MEVALFLTCSEEYALCLLHLDQCALKNEKVRKKITVTKMRKLAINEKMKN